MEYSVIRALPLIAAFLIPSCQKESTVESPKTEPRPRVKDANFVLHVLNASTTRKLVDIQVQIDGRLEIDQKFSSEPSGPVAISIIPHETFEFRLQPGRHTLKASTSLGAASIEQEFEITQNREGTNQRWALLGYDYWSGQGKQPPPGNFELTFQDTPIHFQ